MADETTPDELENPGEMLREALTSRGLYVVGVRMLNLIHEAIEMAAKGHEEVAVLTKKLCEVNGLPEDSVAEALDRMEETASVLRKVRGILIEITDYVPAGV